MKRWFDRQAAGEDLAEALALRWGNAPRLLILALPRGGVPVAFPVARRLGAPLDVLIVRKLGLPAYPELAMGAVTNGGPTVLNDDVLARHHVTNDLLEAVAHQEKEEIVRREALYRVDLPPLDARDRTVLLVDDGLATGATMRAALRSLRMQNPATLIVAVPVAPASIAQALRDEADDVVCLSTPEPFFAVGSAYEDFTQTSDDEVKTLLARSRRPTELPRGAWHPPSLI